MSVLPPGWVWTDTASIAEVQGGIQKQPKRAPRSNRYPFLRVANVLRGQLDLQQIHEIELFDGELDKFRLRHGDLLVVEGNGSPNQIGRAALWQGEIENCVHQNHLIRVRPTTAIDPKYLAYYWNASRTTEHLRSIASSTSGLYVLTAAKVLGVHIPLPPLKEQGQIVAAIEEQFSLVDAGVAALDRARRNLKRVRAAVLQQAVNTALEDTGGDLMHVAGLLSRPLTNGKSVPDGPPEGFPVLRLSAVREGRIDISCVKAGAWTASDARNYLIAKGDYLVVRGNGSKRLVGRGGLVAEDENIAYPDTLIRVRFDQRQILPQYAALIWDSNTVRAQIEAKARTTAGIYKINQLDLEQLAVPVPGISEQQRILAQVESRLAVVAAVEKAVEMSSLHIGALRSSILIAAFSGELVPQDPNDEPAAVLLDRIAANQAFIGHKRASVGRARSLSPKATI